MLVPADFVKTAHKYGIKDSKSLSSATILDLAPKLIQLLEHTNILLSPQEYNHIYSDLNNLNLVLGKLHAQAILSLTENSKYANVPVFVDKFGYPKCILDFLPTEYPNPINFLTHGENKILGIAIASIISRFYFLQQIDQLSATYNMLFQKGANHNVNTCLQHIVNKIGKNNLYKVAKIHFSNISKTLDMH